MQYEHNKLGVTVFLLLYFGANLAVFVNTIVTWYVAFCSINPSPIVEALVYRIRHPIARSSLRSAKVGLC